MEVSNNRPPSVEDDLIRRFNAGEIRCFDSIFDLNVKRVVVYLFHRLGNWEDARDTAQEVFLKVFQALPEYIARGKFRSWLLTIARRTMIDLLRRRGKGPRIECENDLVPALALDGLPGSNSAGSGGDLLRELTEIEREVLLLKVVEEIPYSEISQITGFTVGSLRKVTCRAMRRLRHKETEHELHQNQ